MLLIVMIIPISLASIGNNLYFDNTNGIKNKNHINNILDVNEVMLYCKNNNNCLYSSSSTNCLVFGITAKN